MYNSCAPLIPKSVQTSILQSIMETWAFLHTDTMGVSFLVDHTRKNADFVDADLADNVDSMKMLAERLGIVTMEAEKQEIGDEASKFQLKTGRRSPDTRAKEEALSPMARWSDKIDKIITDDNYYPLLAPLATSIYTIPTSSGATERSWSIREFIHTKRRSRLDAKRVENLVFFYCNTGNKNAKANIFYRIEGESDSDDADDDGINSINAALDEAEENSEDSAGFTDENDYSCDGSEDQKQRSEFEC